MVAKSTPFRSGIRALLAIPHVAPYQPRARAMMRASGMTSGCTSVGRVNGGPFRLKVTVKVSPCIGCGQISYRMGRVFAVSATMEPRYTIGPDDVRRGSIRSKSTEVLVSAGPERVRFQTNESN